MKRFSLIYLIFILFAASVQAAPAVSPPEINAKSAILLDAASGRVLYEKNADVLIPPASMTKLMTIHTALEFIKNGSISADTLVPISKNADFRNAPPRSSLMFIEEGQKVSLIELLQGLAIPSGNDAGIAVAEFLAGSMEDFIALMNRQAAGLGMMQTHFEDSSGYSELNVTTAREYAEFCRIYIEENSSYIEQLHLPLSFTYPEDKNLPASKTSVHGPIRQPNHNLLIGRMAGVDGLKTGYIEESGYNFAATAVSGDRRLVLVTMGGPGNSSYDGSLKRAIDASVLLSYGFYAWTEFTPEVPQHESIAVRGGTKDVLSLTYSPASDILLKTAMIDEIVFIPEIRDIQLPVSRGALVGRWRLMLRDTELQNGVITAAETVERGNIIKRIIDSIR